METVNVSYSIRMYGQSMSHFPPLCSHCSNFRTYSHTRTLHANMHKARHFCVKSSPLLAHASMLGAATSQPPLPHDPLADSPRHPFLYPSLSWPVAMEADWRDRSVSSTYDCFIFCREKTRQIRAQRQTEKMSSNHLKWKPSGINE